MVSERKGKQGNILKVIELGLQDKVYNAMKKTGFSVDGLCKELNATGVQISSQSISKFIKQTKKAQQQLIKKDIKASQELIKLSMDYNKALKDILNEVEEVKNSAKDDKDYTTYNQLIGRLLQGIELFAKLTGDIKPKGTTDIKIIYNEINNNIEQEMKDVTNTLDTTIKIDIDEEITKEDKEMEKIIR